MSFSVIAIILPLAGALLLFTVGGPRLGAGFNAILSTIGLALTVLVWEQAQAVPLAEVFGVLSGFAGLLAALANIRLVLQNVGYTSARRWRCYHALFQLFLGLNLLGLYADNIGLLWLALGGETMAIALGISLSESPGALKAAWASMLLGSVGVGLALLGTLLVYLAAQPGLGTSMLSMSFTALSSPALHYNQSLLVLGVILALLGYGTKIFPTLLSSGMPEHHAAGPLYLAYVPQGLFANVVLLAILHFRHLLQEYASADLVDVLLLVFAISSLLFSAFALPRQCDIRRFLGILVSLQSVLSLFAFGVGGMMAIFGGLLQMFLQSLLKTGLFLALAESVGGDKMLSHLMAPRGLSKTKSHNLWAFGVALFALSGLPPSGLFVSQFLIIRQTILYNPWLCLPLSLGLGLCALPVVRYAGSLLFSPMPTEKKRQTGLRLHLSLLPLGLFFVMAFAMPHPLVHLLVQAAGALQ